MPISPFACKFKALCLLLTTAFLASPAFAKAASTGQNYLIDGYYDIPAGEFADARFTNETVGAYELYLEGYLGGRSIIANVEAGLIWGGHEVFDRSGIWMPNAPTVSIYGTSIEGDAPALGELAQHATMVGHVLAGTGYVGNGSFSYLGMGMAPLAQLWSGAIATEFNEDGEFDVSNGSFLYPYKAFFNGTLGEKADVINSSWGFPDRAGIDFMTATIDGLARQNSTVTMVQSAGNSGADSVNGLGSGYNGITVGSVSGASSAGGLHAPSDFTSYGAADFYNPETNTTVTGVRATVHLAAPGENYALAYYPEDGTESPDPSLYAVNANGTSFSAPLVAGGVALLKDISYSGDILALDTDTARDTRVIRSILMAGAVQTLSWDNGQQFSDGAIRTTQSLDYKTGAGMMNLTHSASIYRDGTIDVAGLGGGAIESRGWDFGAVANNGTNDYLFSNPFTETIELTISLNWFNNRAFDNNLNITSDVSYVNLDLQIWSVENGFFKSLVASSESLYNNSEFLRIVLSDSGQYGIRVLFAGIIFNLSETTLLSEEYALAWRTEIVPEPSTYLLFIAATATLLVCRRKGS